MLNHSTSSFFIYLSPILVALNRHCPFEPSKWNKHFLKSEAVFSRLHYNNMNIHISCKEIIHIFTKAIKHSTMYCKKVISCRSKCLWFTIFVSSMFTMFFLFFCKLFTSVVEVLRILNLGILKQVVTWVRRGFTNKIFQK